MLCGAISGTASASAATTCAATAANPQSSSSPSPGGPCWTDVEPYPFGADGGPADPTAGDCGDDACYLPVESMAFRSWNRGLALVSGNYAVWTYNGSFWEPNASFPGQSTCQGNTILWAGKLDYWVIGVSDRESNWTALCRYDGVDQTWESLPIPPSALAVVPNNADGTKYPGSITAGVCLAWNNCWFFGSYGVELHWDGTSLTGEPAGLGVSPWLETDYQAAGSATDAGGQTVALAVGDATTGAPGATQPPPLATQPNGADGPTVSAFAGEGFDYTSLDPAGTTRVAVALGSNGDGWITGESQTETTPGSGTVATPELTAVSGAGDTLDCPNASGTPVALRLLWSGGALAVLPDGDALAGGTLETQPSQPVLVDVPCSGTPTLTEFVGPDPTAADPATAPDVPADEGASVTSVSASAANDAWAATGVGHVQIPNSDLLDTQPPHLYQYTDGQAPAAPAGDDNETRPVTETSEPTLFTSPPPVIVTTRPAATVVKKPGKHKVKTEHLLASVYAFRFSRPTAAGHGLYKLVLTFKLRRPARLDVEALRGKQVIASTGMRRFHSRSGRLVFLLNPKRWPTGWKVSLPRAGK